MASARRLICGRHSAGRADHACRLSVSMSHRVRAYVALTKPRIIELLLVTTVPAMVLAARGFPGGWLLVATLVGEALLRAVLTRSIATSTATSISSCTAPARVRSSCIRSRRARR